jgi:hypothetical protein
MMPEMDIDAALNVLDQAVASIQTTRQNHEIISKALEIVKKRCS